MPNVVELVGLPGAGKSTLAQRLHQSGKVLRLDPVLRRAAAAWWMCAGRGRNGRSALKVINRATGGRLFDSNVFLHRFLADNKTSMREYHRSNPGLTTAIASWLKEGVSDEVTELRFFEHVGTLYIVAARQHLLDRYAPECNRPVLIDEHWLQLLSFMMNWGAESQWRSWMSNVFEHVPLPSKVVWLTNASSVSEARQLKRNKLAPLFFGCSDIAAKGQQLEKRFVHVQRELVTRGVEVIMVPADRPVDVVTSDVIAALKQV